MKVLAENKKAYFDYEILEKFEAGMVLNGQEVKSMKSGRTSLKGSYVVLKKSSQGKLPEPYLIGANIPPYQPKNAPKDYDPERSRKLLLKKSKYLIVKTKEKGLTLMPLKVYIKNVRIKLVFGIAKGKKKTDKREIIKKREIDREIQKALKR